MNRIKNIKIQPSIIFSLLLILSIFSISLGYSSFHTVIGINDLAALVRINRDIRITKVSVDSASNGAVSMYEEFNEHNLAFNVKLPNQSSQITYRVKVANFGNVPSGIFAITGLPSALTYEFSSYTLKSKLCDSSNNCSTGMEKELLLIIKYKSNAFTSSKVDYTLNLNVEFSPFYTVSFNANGGSVTPASKDVMYKDVYGELPTPTRVGYNFNSWQVYNNTIESTSVMDTPSNHSLIAKWDIKSYDVKVTSSNATVSNTSLKIEYGGYKDIDVTPNSGFYLKSVTCDGGYTATGFNVGVTATGKQTIRINNNSKDIGSTCAIEIASTGPKCSWGSINYIRTNETGNITLTCDSYNGFNSTNLSTSDFTSSNVDIGKVTSLTLSSSTSTKRVYNVEIRGVASGSIDLSIRQNALVDNNNNGNSKLTKSSIKIVGFDVNSTNVSLNLGSTRSFQIQIIGGNYGTVTYSSSNSNIVSVSSTGLIKSVATGTATITVKEGTYGLTNTINVTVSDKLVVNYELTYLKSSNTATSHTAGATYSTTLSPTNTLLYGRPDSIKIYVNDSLLSSSNYTYNNVSGSLSIPNVNGDLKIVAVANVLSSENISFEKPKVLSSTGTINSIAITQAYQLRIFEFVPKKTGSYTFKSFDPDADENNTDPYVYLFDGSVHTRAELDAAAEIYAANGDYDSLEELSVDYDDDGGEGYNFSITKNLEAGKTYFYAVRTYSPEKMQTFVDIRLTYDTATQST